MTGAGGAPEVRFDRVAILDWSSAGTPARGADSIWLGVASGDGLCAVNLPTRAAAAAALDDLVRDSLSRGDRLLIGVDFLLGYPLGFGRALTGSDDPVAVWAWLAARITDDARNRHNLRDVAAAANAAFAGPGPFWGNGARADVPGLTRTKPAALPPGLAAHRATEIAARACGAQPKTAWQLAGAGSVGAQGLVGLPVLHRLRQTHAGRIAVWPFEDIAAPNATPGATHDATPDAPPVVLAEVYPSLLGPAVAAACARDRGLVRDAAQVRLLAGALLRLARTGGLAALFDVPDPAARTEGWILGVGSEAALRAAASPSDAGPDPAGDHATTADPAPAPALDAAAANPVAADPVAGDPVAGDPVTDVGPLPVAVALDRLRTSLRPVTDAEACPTHAAAGRILSAPVTARRAHPARANAAVDGFGLAHGAVAAGAGPWRLPLLAGRAAAGRPFGGSVPPGAALRVTTGAVLPDGVDTVVPLEAARITEAVVILDAPVPRGANIRRAGEDMAEGALALAAGHRLRAPDLALLSVLGVAEVPVRRRLRVGVLSTGDEILPAPDSPALPHQVWDANRPMLMALVGAWGHGAVDLGHAGDDPAAIAARLDDGAARCDVIVTSGGASVGEADHVTALLRARGRLSVWRVAAKPGRALALAAWGRVPVLGLPGNPVAALVAALVFGYPALSLLAGSGWRSPAGFTVPAAFARSKRAGRREYLRARLTDSGAAEVFAAEGSGRISGLSWATGLVELPDAACDIRPGTPVRFLPYAAFGI